MRWWQEETEIYDYSTGLQYSWVPIVVNTCMEIGENGEYVLGQILCIYWKTDDVRIWIDNKMKSYNN